MVYLRFLIDAKKKTLAKTFVFKRSHGNIETIQK